MCSSFHSVFYSECGLKFSKSQVIITMPDITDSQASTAKNHHPLWQKTFLTPLTRQPKLLNTFGTDDCSLVACLQTGVSVLFGNWVQRFLECSNTTVMSTVKKLLMIFPFTKNHELGHIQKELPVSATVHSVCRTRQSSTDYTGQYRKFYFETHASLSIKIFVCITAV